MDHLAFLDSSKAPEQTVRGDGDACLSSQRESLSSTDTRTALVFNEESPSGRRELSIEFLGSQGYFDMPLNHAAELLELSAGSLKRICRKLGLARWPFRVRKSLKAVIDKTEKFMDDSAGSESKQEVLESLKAQMENVKGISQQGINESTRKYRQAIFKLNHRLAKRAHKKEGRVLKVSALAAKEMQNAAPHQLAELRSQGYRGSADGASNYPPFAFRPSALPSSVRDNEQLEPTSNFSQLFDSPTMQHAASAIHSPNPRTFYRPHSAAPRTDGAWLGGYPSLLEGTPLQYGPRSPSFEPVQFQSHSHAEFCPPQQRLPVSPFESVAWRREAYRPPVEKPCMPQQRLPQYPRISSWQEAPRLQAPHANFGLPEWREGDRYQLTHAPAVSSRQQTPPMEQAYLQMPLHHTHSAPPLQQSSSSRSQHNASPINSMTATQGGVPDQSLSSFFSDLDDVDFDAIAFGSGPNNPVEDGLLEDYHSDSLYP